MKIEVNFNVDGYHSKVEKYDTHTEYSSLVEFSGIVQIIDGGNIQTVKVFKGLKLKSSNELMLFALENVRKYLGLPKELPDYTYNHNCIKHNSEYLTVS